MEHKRHQQGFTLVEIIVVLAISALVAAVSIPSAIGWYETYQNNERQANVELIYTTAQNNMAALKAEGKLGDADKQPTSATGARSSTLASALAAAKNNSANTKASSSAIAADSDMIVLDSDDPAAADALKLLVPDIESQFSRVGFSTVSYATDFHYCIELNPKTGYIYRTFFGDETITDRYENAAQLASEGNDQKLNSEMHINYYGGTKPKTFDPDEIEPIRGVGYFEFAQTSNDNEEGAQVTGGYYYEVSQDNKTIGDLKNTLGTGNSIDENVKDKNGNTISYDGSAYGVLAPKTEVDKGSFTAPSDVSTTRYEVTASDTPYYFYKLDTPPSAATEPVSTTYNVVFQYYDDTSNPYWPHYADITRITKHGNVGEKARVTNDDLSTVGAYLNNGYGISDESTIEADEIQQYGQTTLYVKLKKGATQRTIDESGPETTLTNGTGTWYPWATAGNTDLVDKAFTVNQNFAAAIAKGKDQGEEIEAIHQIRTDDQLQHIGSPYGSTSAKPITRYLSGTFYQTHDITIDNNRDGDDNASWQPIGQAQSTVDDHPQFSGTYYGGYKGQNDANTQPSGAFEPEPPSQSDERFSLNIDSGFVISNGAAYQTSGASRSDGIFGYVTGTIDHVHVVLEGKNSEPATVSQTLTNPHYGTLVGDLENGTVSNSRVTIPSGSSLHVRQISEGASSAAGATVLGGMIGSMDGAANLSNCSLILEQSSTDNQGDTSSAQDNPRLELVSEAGWTSQQGTNTGGLVGSAAGDTGSFSIDQCSIELHDAAHITGEGASGGTVNIAGFVALATGSGTITNSRMEISNGMLSIGSPEDASWGPAVSSGGFVGRLDSNTQQANTQQQQATSIESSTVDIADTGALSIQSSYANGSVLASGGFTGRMVGSTSLASDTIDNDGTLEVTGGIANGTVRFGGFVGSENAEPNASSEAATATCTVTSCHLTGSGTLSVRADSKAQSVFAGGFAGVASYRASITDSSTKLDGDISVISEDSQQSPAYLGGFAGAVQQDASITSPTVNSKDGSVTVTAKAESGETNVGGIVGKLEGRASLGSPALNAGKDLIVSASGTSSSAFAGGLIGHASSESEGASVKNAGVTIAENATVTSNSGNANYAGGIVGLSESVGLDNVTATFNGDLTATAQASWSEANAGGIAGKLSGKTASNSLSLTASKKLAATASSSNGETHAAGGIAKAEGITTISDSSITTSDADISASSSNRASAAGFIGIADGTATISKPSVTVNGSASMTTDGKGSSPAYAAGLIGLLGANATASDATLDGEGSVTAQATTTGWSASTYAAGLVGLAEASESTSSMANAAIDLSGNLSVISNSNHNDAYAGGIVNFEKDKTSNVSLANPKTSVRGDLTLHSTGGSDAYTGGILSYEKSSAGSAVIGNPQVNVGGDATLQSNSSNKASTGSIAGQVESVGLESAAVSVDGNLTTASEGQGEARSGGLIGSAKGQADIASPSVTVKGNLDASVNSHGDTAYTGGLIGNAQGRISITNPKLTDESNGQQNGTSKITAEANGQSSAAGLIGYLREGASVTDSVVNIANSLEVSGSSNNSSTFAAGLVGYTLSDSNTPRSNVSHSNTTVAGTLLLKSDSPDDSSYVGGLIGNLDSSKLDDAHLSVHAMNATATTAKTAYAGGLVGHATSLRGGFLSLRSVSDSSDDALSITANSTTDDGYVGGMFGGMYDSSVQNSYLASAKAPLKLGNPSKNAYTGGFAGRVQSRAQKTDYAIDSSYVAAPIESSAHYVAGFVDRADVAHDRNPIFTNNHVLATMSGSTAQDHTYAFIRRVSYAKGVKANYAAVTNTRGETPYQFAGAASGTDLNDEDDGTSRCFIYDADQTQGSDRKKERSDGAHPASYAYLTDTPNPAKETTVSWNKDKKSSSVLDFIGLSSGKYAYSESNPTGYGKYNESGYLFVAGKDALGDNGEGSNPFPTATKDKDGKYVNYGKWIPKP